MDNPTFQYHDYVFKKTKDFFFSGRVIARGQSLKGGQWVYLVQDPETGNFTVAAQFELTLYERPATKVLPPVKPSKY